MQLLRLRPSSRFQAIADSFFSKDLLVSRLAFDVIGGQRDVGVDNTSISLAGAGFDQLIEGVIFGGCRSGLRVEQHHGEGFVVALQGISHR